MHSDLEGLNSVSSLRSHVHCSHSGYKIKIGSLLHVDVPIHTCTHMYTHIRTHTDTHTHGMALLDNETTIASQLT